LASFRKNAASTPIRVHSWPQRLFVALRTLMYYDVAPSGSLMRSTRAAQPNLWFRRYAPNDI
jgi:hypothetical protein